MRYNDEIIDFFKRHNLYEKEMFDYLQKQTDMVDYRVEEDRIYIGCGYNIDHITQRILGFRICIPYAFDEITTLICIHEIAHGIWGYKKLNQKYKSLEVELFPMRLEKVYITERASEILNNYANYLDSTIDENSDEKYRFALLNRDKLDDSALSSFKSIDKHTRKLAKSWKRFNR